MEFVIYDDSTGGVMKWAETHPSVTVEGGSFSTILGTTVPIDDSVFNQPDRWLGITVGSDPELPPRTRLVSVGYAHRVGTIDGSTGGIISGDVSVQSDLVVSGKATIGPYHTNSGMYAFVAGRNNVAGGNYSAVAGGRANTASQTHSAVGGGFGHTAGGTASTVAGGYENTASAPYSTVGGGVNNTANVDWATVGGGLGDTASALAATVAGGYENTASGQYSTVCGGEQSRASGDYSTIGGGQYDTAAGMWSTVGGGYLNSADTICSTVSGGGNNTAGGFYATVPGGRSNSAAAAYSFAAGRRAIANTTATGSFVWADANDHDWTCGTANFFTVRSTGGAMFTTAIDGGGMPTAGVFLGPGDNAWNSVSDRNLKENFTSVDREVLLEKLASIPITMWNYKSQDESIRHIGPMAQDFYAAFGMGTDDKRISTIDPDGIALATIQGLYQKANEQAAEIRALKKQVVRLQALVEAMYAGRSNPNKRGIESGAGK
jgi:hypothetical protein